MSTTQDKHVDLQLSFWELEAYDKLNQNQKLFVEYYCGIHLFNGTQSAIKAGYSANSARSIASELLTHPNIKEAVKARMILIAEENRVDHAMLTRLLTDIITVNPMSFYKFENGMPVLKSMEELTPEQTRAIKSITKTKEGGMKLEFYDKNAAIEKLARHLGYFAEDNAQLNKDQPVTIVLPDNGRDRPDTEKVA